LRTVQKIFLARASFVTCVSRDIATILRLDYEVQADRLCVIPNGFDSNLFLKQKFPLNSSLRNEIVTVANLRPEKDVPTLLRAFSLVKKKVPDARLVVIGDGPMRKFLQDLCLELGLSDSVSFKGHMRQVSVFAEITLAKCFVLSSTEEGFPTVIVEAMFAGTPIVATRVGGVPEIIQNGRNGFLVPKNSPKELSDAILEIILDDGLQARMSDEGRRVALSYSWDNIVVGYMRVYRTCISRS
jgi:glycosyltransferase involved in cell wall biosynthesis